MSKHRKSITMLLVGGFGDKFILFAQGILLVPIYLSTIGVEVYGYWLATGGVLAWLGAFDMRMAVIINQKVSSLIGRGEEGKVAQVFNSGLVAFGLILAPLLPVALMVFSPLVSFLGLPEELRSQFFQAYVYAALGLMLSFVTSALAALPKGLLIPTFPVLIHFLCGLVQIVSVIYLLYSGWGVVAIGFAVFLRFFLSSIINLYYSISLVAKPEYGRNDWVPSFSSIREYIVVMPPMFFSRLTTGLVGKIEPTIILRFLGPEIAASYSITKAAAIVLTGLANSVTASVFPSFATICGGLERHRVEDAFFRCIELLGCASLLYFGGYVLLNEQFVSLWVGHEFFLGSELTGLIALSLTLVAFSNFLNSSITANGDVSYASWLRSAEELSRLLLLVVGTSVFGLFGLPIAVIITAMGGVVAYGYRFRNQFGFSVVSLNRIGNYLTMLLIAPAVLLFAGLGGLIHLESWVGFIALVSVVIPILVFLCFITSSLFRSYLMFFLRTSLSRLRARLA